MIITGQSSPGALVAAISPSVILFKFVDGRKIEAVTLAGITTVKPNVIEAIVFVQEVAIRPWMELNEVVDKMALSVQKHVRHKLI